MCLFHNLNLNSDILHCSVSWIREVVVPINVNYIKEAQQVMPIIKILSDSKPPDFIVELIFLFGVGLI